MACSPQAVPTFISESGVSVYLEGQTSNDFTPAAIDLATEQFAKSFAGRYDGGLPFNTLNTTFMNVDTWTSYGTKVAGETEWDGRTQYIGAQTRRLWEGAFIHEIVHAMDIQFTGNTDSTHESWKIDGGVYYHINQINSDLKQTISNE
jgi:hypothetical protein